VSGLLLPAARPAVSAEGCTVSVCEGVEGPRDEESLGLFLGGMAQQTLTALAPYKVSGQERMRGQDGCASRASVASSHSLVSSAAQGEVDAKAVPG